jgi:hypothetical protein
MQKKLSWLFFLPFYFSAFAQQVKPLQLIAGMHDSVRAIQTARFKISAIERKEDNTFYKAVSENKLQIKPRKLYLLNREKKLEILYAEGERNDKALVKPNTFPYVTLALNPLGSVMRKNQHYSIFEIGFEFMANAIELALSKEKENALKSLTCVGKQNKNGAICHLLVYEAKNFGYTEYTIKEKETVADIATKLRVNEFIIRSKNNLFNEFGMLKIGTRLQVPLYYCKKAVFYLNEKTLLPISISVFDDKGLFENYDFTDIILNKPISSVEFTEDYKDYHF